jgi:gluconate:H+ symporter, GntP family
MGNVPYLRARAGADHSGFWVVTRYLGLSVRDGLRSWTVLTTTLGVAGFALVSLIWAIVSVAGA